MQKVTFYKQFVLTLAAGAALVVFAATPACAEVPDTNSYWENFAAVEKLGRHHLDEARRSCSGRNGNEAEAALKEWKSSLQTAQYPGSDFNPCSGSGTLLAGKISIIASKGRVLRLDEKGDLHTEWDFRNRTVKLWYGGDLISLSVSPIAVSVRKASLGSFGGSGKFDDLAANTSEARVISGLEAFWRSAHEHYPNHSLYDVALQVITGRDEGREMLLDFIRCGKSICD